MKNLDFRSVIIGILSSALIFTLYGMRFQDENLGHIFVKSITIEPESSIPPFVMLNGFGHFGIRMGFDVNGSSLIQTYSYDGSKLVKISATNEQDGAILTYASDGTVLVSITASDSGDGSISLWSAADELKDLYVRQCEMIREYANRGKLLKKVTEVTLIQAMRPFLEDYIRARCPGRFTDQELLFKMAEDIKQAGNTDPMFNSVTDLMSINKYTRPNHHGGGQVPDPTELRAQCKKIVRIIDSH